MLVLDLNTANIKKTRKQKILPKIIISVHSRGVNGDLLSSTRERFISAKAKVMIHHNNQANKSLSGDVTANQEVVTQPEEKQTQSH